MLVKDEIIAMPKWCPQCGAKMKSRSKQNLCDVCRKKLLRTPKMENEEKIEEDKEIEEPPFEEEEAIV